jgi:NusA N-terminal domain
VSGAELPPSYMAKAKQPKSNVSLPQLRVMIDEISKDRNLPSSAVQTALREALLKGYERYRRSQHLDQTSMKKLSKLWQLKRSSQKLPMKIGRSH